LHWRPFHLESLETRAESCRRGRAGAAERVPAGDADAVLRQQYDGWGPEFVKRRPEITMDTVEKFLTKMYRTNPDFVFTVTRDFVRNCQTPVLILRTMSLRIRMQSRWKPRCSRRKPK